MAAYLNKYPNTAYGCRNLRSVLAFHLRETVKMFNVNWSDEERIIFYYYYYLCFIKRYTTNQSEFTLNSIFTNGPAVIKTGHVGLTYHSNK